jgi:hypothetical protein
MIEITIFNPDHCLLGIQLMRYDATNEATEEEKSGWCVELGIIFLTMTIYF